MNQHCPDFSSTPSRPLYGPVRGAVNLATGLQDAYLACALVIALIRRERQINQQRHAYREVNPKLIQ